MTTTAAAIYEQGVLRPLAPLPLAEGTRVELTITDVATETAASGGWKQALSNLRARQTARGHVARSADRVDSDLRGERESWD